MAHVSTWPRLPCCRESTVRPRSICGRSRQTILSVPPAGAISDHLERTEEMPKNLPCLAPRRDIKERRPLTLPGKMCSLPSPYSLSDACHPVKVCFKKPPSRQLASKAGLPTDLVSSATSHENFPAGGSTSIPLFADLSTLPETNRSATCPNHAAWKHGRRCLRTSRGKGLV